MAPATNRSHRRDPDRTREAILAAAQHEFAAKGLSGARVDAIAHRVLRSVPLPQPARPVGVIVSPDGETVFVATGHGNTVLALNADTLAVESVIPVGQRPWGLAISADCGELYSANGISGSVSVIDTRTRTVVAEIKTGDGAWGVALGRTVGR